MVCHASSEYWPDPHCKVNRRPASRHCRSERLAESSLLVLLSSQHIVSRQSLERSVSVSSVGAQSDVVSDSK